MAEAPDPSLSSIENGVSTEMRVWWKLFAKPFTWWLFENKSNQAYLVDHNYEKWGELSLRLFGQHERKQART